MLDLHLLEFQAVFLFEVVYVDLVLAHKLIYIVSVGFFERFERGARLLSGREIGA